MKPRKTWLECFYDLEVEFTKFLTKLLPDPPLDWSIDTRKRHLTLYTEIRVKPLDQYRIKENLGNQGFEEIFFCEGLPSSTTRREQSPKDSSCTLD